MSEIDLIALADCCEAATGPDRDLDAEIAIVQGLRVTQEGHPLGLCCYDASGRIVMLPRYTASLDAAMTLVPSWLTPTIIGHDREVRLYNGIGLTVRGQNCKSHGASLALALCAAALRARAAKGISA